MIKVEVNTQLMLNSFYITISLYHGSKICGDLHTSLSQNDNFVLDLFKLLDLFSQSALKRMNKVMNLGQSCFCSC